MKSGMKWAGILILCCSGVMASGCSYVTAVPSVAGRAFLVRSGSDFWNCDATTGEPVCYQTKQVLQPKVTK